MVFERPLALSVPGSALLALFLLAARPGQAQVTLGYSNPITSTATRTRIGFQGVRSTQIFNVEGNNVEPIDGSLVYDETTRWRIFNPNNAFSLNVDTSDPKVELQQDKITRDDVRVQRVEALSATVSGPLASTLPDDPRDWVTPRETALPAPLLSVFADTGGP
jgi:hypothetical protein